MTGPGLHDQIHAKLPQWLYFVKKSICKCKSIIFSGQQFLKGYHFQKDHSVLIQKEGGEEGLPVR